jgi:hypothetical protein
MQKYESMRSQQKIWLASGILFFLLLVSYKFSLLHEANMLPYLQNPVIPPFQRLFTYVFMMIGIIPTVLLILYTSILCHTEFIASVTTICFGSPFNLSDSGGFFAYIVACIITTGIIFYLWTSLTEKKV